MALDFPTSPTVGQQYGGYVFDGTKWKVSTTSTAPAAVQPTPPTNPTVGDMWFNSTDGTMYFYYNDGSTAQWVESRAPIVANGYYSPNYIINSAFDIWQRGTSTASGAGATYAADRWAFGASGTSGRTVSRQATSLTAFQYCARVQRDSGQTNTNTNYYAQNIESINSIPLAGKTVTISYYARAGANYSSASNTLVVNLYSGTGTDQNFIAIAITGQATVATSSATLTTSWQRFTATGTVSSSATQLFFVATNTPVGTAGANDYFEITGVQLEEGSAATTFRRNANSLQGELAACQRYYQRFTSLGAYTPMAGSGFVTGSTNTRMHFVPAVPGRIAPTSMTVSNFGIYDTYQVFNVGSYALVTPTPTFFAADFTISGGTQYRPTFGYANGSGAGYVDFNMEL